MADTLATFRVHFEDETKLDIPAASTTDARKLAEQRHDGIIRKIKLIREAA